MVDVLYDISQLGYSHTQQNSKTGFIWLELWLPGGLSQRSDDQQFYAEAAQAAVGPHVQVRASLEQAELKAEYKRASIFWHAAEYGKEEANPRLMEHFGISTGEAMAAGCVPVVIAQGGQPEVVEHGVSRFAWNTLDELKEYMRRLRATAPCAEK